MIESESCYSEAEMQEILNELEQSIEDREQKQSWIEQLEREVSELSLQNFELMKELRSKSEMIKSLNDRIGTMSESDKVLKQNDRLQWQNEQLREEAEAMISSVKEEYSRKERELAQTQAEADQAKKDIEATRSRQKMLIQEKVTQVYNARKAVLERKYRAKTGSYYSFLLGCLLYGLLTTVFTAVRSDRFVADFKDFFTGLWAVVCWISGLVMQMGQAVAELGDKIQQPAVAITVHWMLLIVVVGGIGATLVVLFLWLSKKLLDFYKEDYADIESLTVFLISLAVAVFFAERIRIVIPLNLLLLLLLIHATYMGIRWYLVNKCDKWV